MRITVKSKNKRISILPSFIMMFCLLGLFNCQRAGRVLERKVLFSLQLGQMEKQLDFIVQPDAANYIKNDFIHKNGLFYISDSRRNKVMTLTSQGDLISLFYNPDQNPAPITLYSEANEQNLSSNLNAYKHQFLNIRNITIDSKKKMMIDEAVDSGRVEVDKENGVVLNRTIRRLSHDGKFIDDLGQEGVGGLPFPFIHNLQVTKDNQLTVVCRTKDFWKVYSFTEEGEPLFNIQFFDNQLPTVVEGRLASLEDISINYQNSELYLKINFYESKSLGKGHRGGPYFSDTAVWVYDLKKNTFSSHFDLPQKLIFDETLRTKREVIYEFVGLDNKGHLFYLAPNDDLTNEILVMSHLGKVINRFRIAIEDKESYDKIYNISPEGVLSALVVCYDHVDIVQWRTDWVARGDVD